MQETPLKAKVKLDTMSCIIINLPLPKKHIALAIKDIARRMKKIAARLYEISSSIEEKKPEAAQEEAYEDDNLF